MNITNIDWCDLTWNPVTGCLHGCEYCYARNMVESGRLKGAVSYPNGFAPTFHEKRLYEPNAMTLTEKLKQNRTKKGWGAGDIDSPMKIFAVSMGDLFGSWVSVGWIERVVLTVKVNPEKVFQFLTKNPSRYLDFDFPRNAWLGITVDGMSSCVAACEAIKQLRTKFGDSTCMFISFEPLTEDLNGSVIRELVENIDWAIVGARTGSGAFQPERKWVDNIEEMCRMNSVPLLIKNNLKWHRKVKEFPKWDL